MNLSVTDCIKNCPDSTPVASVNAEPHAPAAIPKASAVAVLIQLPPTMITFLPDQDAFSESLYTTLPIVAPPVLPVETAISPELI